MDEHNNNNFTLKLGELIGQVSALHSRFNGIDGAITAVRESVHSQVLEHEQREDARLSNIEKALETLKRLVWIGFGGTVVLGGVLTFLIRTIK